MQFKVEIHNVQQIGRFSLNLNLAEKKLTCLVGRNGVGKTTLVRSLKNLSQADTFLHTAPPGIFSSDSRICYWVNGEKVTFAYDPHIERLNCKKEIPQNIRRLCTVELPIPHGSRFEFFQSISRVDRDIRRQIILEEYSCPEELVKFLSDIYSSEKDKFRSLIKTDIRGNSYFSLLRDDGTYIREDYFSSGEYFLVSLYRTIITGSARLIVVDEIDISLDAVAQVRLIKELRELCIKYDCNVLFTTHSLAMMRTLDDRELFYMEHEGMNTVLTPASYSYIKSRLFGFFGYDRYILTEDRVLRDFLETFIRRCCKSVFFKYTIIYIGGASQVVDLLARNRNDRFFAEPNNVITVLDGDQRETKSAQESNVYCLPFQNVEEALHECYEEDDFPYRLDEGKGFNGPKDLFNSLQRDKVMDNETINRYICEKNEMNLGPLASVLVKFLSSEMTDNVLVYE